MPIPRLGICSDPILRHTKLRSSFGSSAYKSIFHGFFAWMQGEGFRADNPAVRLPKVRVPKVEPDPVTTDDIEYLLASGIYRRTRMWVLLYAYQGFRAQEIAAVHGTHSVDWNRRRLLSLDGKNGKDP